MAQIGPHRREIHPKAGKVFRVVSGRYAGMLYWLENWQVNVYNGQRWQDAQGNMAACEYAFRCGLEMGEAHKNNETTELDPNDEVFYGKIGILSKMMHPSQIGDEVPDATYQDVVKQDMPELNEQKWKI